MKPKYRIESYEVRESSGRCWGCCQENSECSHETYSWTTYYRIRKNSKVIKEYLYSESDAQRLIRTVYNETWRKQQNKKQIKRLQREIQNKRKEIDKLRKKI